MRYIFITASFKINPIFLDSIRIDEDTLESLYNIMCDNKLLARFLVTMVDVSQASCFSRALHHVAMPYSKVLDNPERCSKV